MVEVGTLEGPAGVDLRFPRSPEVRDLGHPKLVVGQGGAGPGAPAFVDSHPFTKNVNGWGTDIRSRMKHDGFERATCPMNRRSHPC